MKKPKLNKKNLFKFDFVPAKKSFRDNLELELLQIIDSNQKFNSFSRVLNFKSVFSSLASISLVITLIFLANTNVTVLSTLSGSSIPLINDYALSREIDLIMDDLESFEVSL